MRMWLMWILLLPAIMVGQKLLPSPFPVGAGGGGGGGGGTAVAPYFTTVTGQTSVSISAATHGQGVLAVAYCFDNSTPRIAVSCDQNYTRDSSGNLVFTFSPAFTGLIEVGSGGGVNGAGAGNVTCTGSFTVGNLLAAANTLGTGCVDSGIPYFNAAITQPIINNSSTAGAESDTGTWNQNGCLIQRKDGLYILIYGNNTGDWPNMSQGLVKMRTSQTFAGLSTATPTSPVTASDSIGGVACGIASTGRIFLFYTHQSIATQTLISENWVYSDDGAATWSAESSGLPLHSNTMTQWAYGDPVLLNSGILLMSWYGSDGTTFNFGTFSSADNGKTWVDGLTIYNSSAENRSEFSIVAAGGDYILGMARRIGQNSYQQYLSSNAGSSFSSIGTKDFGCSGSSIRLAYDFNALGDRIINARCTASSLVVNNQGMASSLIANGTGGWYATSLQITEGLNANANGMPTALQSLNGPKAFIWYGNAKSSSNDSMEFSVVPNPAIGPLCMDLTNFRVGVNKCGARSAFEIGAQGNFSMSTETTSNPATGLFDSGNDYMTATQVSGSNLGFLLQGYSKNGSLTTGLQFLGITNGETSGAKGAVELIAAKTSGTSGTALASGSFAFRFLNWTTDVLDIWGDGSIILPNIKTTGAAGGKQVVCFDPATGKLYGSSTGTDCSN